MKPVFVQMSTTQADTLATKQGGDHQAYRRLKGVDWCVIVSSYHGASSVRFRLEEAINVESNGEIGGCGLVAAYGKFDCTSVPQAQDTHTCPLGCNKPCNQSHLSAS